MPSNNKVYKKYIYEVRHSLLSPLWSFHGPYDTISALTREAIIKSLKYGHLKSRHFHRYKAYNALPKSLVPISKEKFRFKNTIFSIFSKLLIL
jgi:hypothetical protein